MEKLAAERETYQKLLNPIAQGVVITTLHKDGQFADNHEKDIK